MTLYRPFLLVCLFMMYDLSSAVVVQTNHGPVNGNVTTYNGQSLKTFMGIPYAKPPIGQLRFKPPQDPEPWTRPLIASEYSPMCMQQAVPGISGSTSPKNEDCLYLNVYVPVTASAESLPVMVWIHGGGLVIGSAGDFPPHGLALYGEVIVVTINYRLDVFGFFTTGSDAAEGNLGMLDQVAALKWVKANIASFGGDADRVTIFGESAGSWSVTSHLISPLSDGLFQRVIAQSGSVQNFLLDTSKERMEWSKALVSGLGCTLEDEDEMLECLQDKSSDEIATQSLLTPYKSPNSSVPMSVGGSFLPLQPEVMWSTYTPSADLMIGVNSEEMSFLILVQQAAGDILQNGVSTDDPVFEMVTGLLLGTYKEEIPLEKLKNIFMAQYFGNLEKEDKIGTLRAVLDAGADRYFISPSLLTAMSTLASGRDVYTYYFSEVTKTQALGSAIPLFFPYVAAIDSGAGHATELMYTMGQIATPKIPRSLYDMAREVDRNMSLSMMKAWSSFAKTGKPKFLSSDGDEVEWPLYSADDKKCVEFRSPMSAESVRSDVFAQAEKFWNVLLPTVIDQYRVDGDTGPGQSDDNVSLIDRATAETILFLLIAVVIVLSIVAVLSISSYCGARKELKQLEKDAAYKPTL